jgi:hypothetical protein
VYPSSPASWTLVTALNPQVLTINMTGGFRDRFALSLSCTPLLNCAVDRNVSAQIVCNPNQTAAVITAVTDILDQTYVLVLLM